MLGTRPSPWHRVLSDSLRRPAFLLSFRLILVSQLRPTDWQDGTKSSRQILGLPLPPQTDNSPRISNRGVTGVVNGKSKRKLKNFSSSTNSHYSSQILHIFKVVIDKLVLFHFGIFKHNCTQLKTFTLILNPKLSRWNDSECPLCVEGSLLAAYRTFETIYRQYTVCEYSIETWM